jgi:hypothetical protein
MHSPSGDSQKKLGRDRRLLSMASGVKTDPEINELVEIERGGEGTARV